jgi:RHS repeat-associated protein
MYKRPLAQVEVECMKRVISRLAVVAVLFAATAARAGASPNAAGAMVIDWSIPLNPATFGTGVVVQQLVPGRGWVPMSGDEVAVGTKPGDDNALAVMATAGWVRGRSYRVLLRPSLTDRQGRSIGEVAPIEWTVPAGENAEVQYAREFPVIHDSARAASEAVGGRFPGGQTMLFHGAFTDPVTGFAYHRARWYDPRSASWLSEDPLGAIDSTNLYAFAGLRPHVSVDPLGTDDWEHWEEWEASQEARRKQDEQYAAWCVANPAPCQADKVRRQGLGQIVLGGFQLAGSIELGATPAGWFLAGRGAENAITGLKQAWTGQPQATLIGAAAEGVATGLGATPREARGYAALADITADVGTALVPAMLSGPPGRILYHYTSVAGAEGIAAQGRILASEQGRLWSVNATGVSEAGVYQASARMGNRSNTPNVFFTDVAPNRMTPELAAQLGIKDTSRVVAIPESALVDAGIPVFRNPHNDKVFNAVAPSVPVNSP